jgi:hypothetical protein
MWELLATNGEQAVRWGLAALGMVLARLVWVRISNDWARHALGRAYDEVTAAVLEVWQTYVSEIKRAKVDGLLTDAEKREARRRAVAVAKDNLGTKGLKRLANALGVSRFFGEADAKVERWLESKTEAVVAGLKATGVMKNGVAPGTYAQPAKPLTRNPS